MNRLKSRKAIVVGSLVVLCLICVGLGSLSGGRPTPTLGPLASEPTVTAKPVETTHKPAETPVPTSTPEPTGTVATIRARDEQDELLPGGVVNVWDNYETRGKIVAKCEDGEWVIMLERSDGGVLIETADGTRGWVTYWFIRELYATPTPAPTAISNPEPPPAIQLYALQINDKATRMGEALASLSELAQQPRFGDDTWTLEIATQIAMIKLLRQQVADMDEVPEEMMEIRAALLDAIGDLDQAMDYLATGIDDLSVPDIERATELMNSGTRKLDHVTSLINAYMAQFQ